MRRNITHISVCNPELFLSGVCFFFSSGTIQAPWSMSICLFFKPLFLLRAVGDPREVILLMCGLFTLLGHSGCLVNLPFGFSVVFYRFCLACVRSLITRCRSLVHHRNPPVSSLSLLYHLFVNMEEALLVFFESTHTGHRFEVQNRIQAADNRLHNWVSCLASFESKALSRHIMSKNHAGVSI